MAVDDFSSAVDEAATSLAAAESTDAASIASIASLLGLASLSFATEEASLTLTGTPAADSTADAFTMDTAIPYSVLTEAESMTASLPVSSSETSQSTSSSGSNKGLPIGVGLGLGLAAVLAVAGVWFVRSKRRAAREEFKRRTVALRLMSQV